MVYSGYYRFCKLLLYIDEVGSRSFFDYWIWRLNPYLCHNTTGFEPLVCLSQGGLHDNKQTDSMIGSLGDGLFRLYGYTDDNNDYYWKYMRKSGQDTLALLWMSKGYDKIRILEDKSHTSGYLPFVCLGYLFPYVMLKHDAITFHAALMEHENRGIIISAPSGTGKTTHARLWRDHKRALIINGDRATCCIEDGRWIGFGLPWSGTSGESINRDVPLTAFVVLEQAEENSVERLEGLDAFGVVMQNLLYPSWDRELTEKALDFVDDFIEKIPVFRLRCRPDVEAVEVLERALADL